MPPAYIGLAPDALRYRSARCRPCGRRFAAYERQSPLRLRSMAPLGRHRFAFALAARSVRRSHRLLHCALRSRRRPRAKGATGTFRRLSASRAGRRTHRSPMPFRHGLCSRRLNRAHDPPDSAQRVESLRPVDARCTSLLTRQILGALAAMILPCGACSPGFRAPSARGSRLRRSRGLRPAFGRPVPSKQEGAPRSLSPNAPPSTETAR